MFQKICQFWPSRLIVNLIFNLLLLLSVSYQKEPLDQGLKFLILVAFKTPVQSIEFNQSMFNQSIECNRNILIWVYEFGYLNRYPVHFSKLNIYNEDCTFCSRHCMFIFKRPFPSPIEMKFLVSIF